MTSSMTLEDLVAHHSSLLKKDDELSESQIQSQLRAGGTGVDFLLILRNYSMIEHLRPPNYLLPI